MPTHPMLFDDEIVHENVRGGQSTLVMVLQFLNFPPLTFRSTEHWSDDGALLSDTRDPLIDKGR